MRMILGLAVCAACGGGGSDNDGAIPVDAKAPANNGFVQLSSQSFMANNMMFRNGSASASFTMASGPSTCTEQTSGPCTVYTCSGQQPPPPTNLSAGTIMVTGGAAAVTLAPKADKSYDPFILMSQPLFMGDETLTATGAGADVPAFTVTVTAPSRPTITAPAPPAVGGAIAVNRAQPFHVTWMNRSTAGKINIAFSGPTGSNTSMNCSFDVTALAADVPAAALALLPAGMGNFSASAISHGQTDIGEWRINANGFFNTVWPDGTITSAKTMLQ